MNTKTTQTAKEAAYTDVIPSTPIAFLWFITKPHLWYAVPALLFTLAAQTMAIMMPYVISRLVDEILIVSTKSEQVAVLFHWGVIFVIVLTTTQIAWRLSGLIGLHWMIESNFTAYRSLTDYVTQHSHNYFINRFAGSLSNKISNATDGLGRLMERSLWGMLPEVMALGVIVFLFATVHLYLAFAVFIIIALLFAVNIFLVRKRRPLVVTYSLTSSKLRGEIVDLLTNIAATRQYSRRFNELARLKGVLIERKEKDYTQSYAGEQIMLLNNVAGVVIMSGVLFVMYYMLQASLVSVGQIVLALLLLSRFAQIFTTIGNMMNGFIRMYGEVEEGLRDIVVRHEILDQKNARPLTVLKGEVVWQRVGFQFDSNQVFSDFNLTITAGERIGLVGSSGAGKTTFVSLLLRQHEIDSGQILIDEQNIATVTQDSLRDNIAIVPQEPMLFHRSIRENIAYGKLDATHEEIVAVAKKAQAHEFITQLPEGYDTLVGERGVKLSGGQKQRVAIARAMLKDAPILVLDEATSALDSESEVEIQKALHVLMQGKTVIAVAHRLSTLREMDRIIVLDKGKIVEDGSHEALVEYGGVYAKLWTHQAGGFLQE